MMGNVIQGISDITSSEGKLRRFTRICKLLYPSRVLSWGEVVQLVKEKLRKENQRRELTNEKVIGRHLGIMERLKMLKKMEGGGYVLTGEGEVLYDLTKDVNEFQIPLDVIEKIFYFDSLFSNVSPQIYLLLESVQKNPNKQRNEIIAYFFNRILVERLLLWSSNTIKRGLRKYNAYNELPRGFENRFECMEMWLRDLGLLARENLEPKVTRAGKKVLLKRKDIEKFGRTFRIGSVFITGEPNSLPSFSYQKQKKVFLKLFKTAYSKFESPGLGMSDAKAIRKWICIKLLTNYQLTLEKIDFNVIVNQLVDEGVVRSALSGRDGELAHLAIY